MRRHELTEGASVYKGEGKSENLGLAEWGVILLGRGGGIAGEGGKAMMTAQQLISQTPIHTSSPRQSFLLWLFRSSLGRIHCFLPLVPQPFVQTMYGTYYIIL